MTLTPLTGFLLAVSVIMLICHTLGEASARIGQPRVIGEIMGGLLLGPIALGAIWPNGEATLFPDRVQIPLDLTAQLGLVVFMFLLGSELRTGEVRGHRTVISVVAICSMGIPFLGGVAVAATGYTLIAGSSGTRMLTVVFIGLALAVTALPVMARILVDLGMETSRAGALGLAAAATGDGLMWIALTVLLGFAGTPGVSPGFTISMTLALLAFTGLVVRPGLGYLVHRADMAGRGDPWLAPLMLAGAVGYAVFTQTVGLHLVIGAFLFGVAMPRESALVERISKRLSGFTHMILLPLFFAGMGLKISGAALGSSGAAWMLLAATIAVATLTKFLGGAGGAHLAGLDRVNSWRLGALMNCRGITELVVAGIGYQYHLINTLGLTIITLIALITTATTAPILALIDRLAKDPRPQGKASGPAVHELLNADAAPGTMEP